MEEVTVKVGSIPNIRVSREQYGWYHDDVFQGMRDYGIIEDADRTWIIYLDENGRPESYCGERDESGSTIGRIVPLTES